MIGDHKHLMIRVCSSKGDREGFVRKLCALLDCDFEDREEVPAKDLHE